jgi:putative membrane protein
MQNISNILIGLIAFMHLYILFIEMFAWETKGKKAFAGVIPENIFEHTKVMAANQGLYNGFLAAGLIWSLCITNHDWKLYVSVFFLSCIIIAGIYGAITANRKIFFIQTLPAIITLILLHL